MEVRYLRRPFPAATVEFLAGMLVCVWLDGGQGEVRGVCAPPPPPAQPTTPVHHLLLYSPASCAPTAFRSMWAEFEWENKVAVNTEIKSLREYLDHILKNTNMKYVCANRRIFFVLHRLRVRGGGGGAAQQC